MPQPMQKASRLLILLLTAGGLSALIYLALVARTSSVNTWYQQLVPVIDQPRQHVNLPFCDDLLLTSPPVTMRTSNESRASSEVRSVASISSASTADWKIYQTFRSNNVSSPRDAEMLSPEHRSQLEKKVGVAFPTAARAFKLYDSYVKSFNKCDYKLLSDPGPCNKTQVSTLIVVQSLPQSTNIRMKIRERLRKFSMTGYRLVFIAGRSEASSEIELKKEAATYSDIIWADFWEDYDNLTIKTLMMLRWAERNCLSARYVVKADDDVYLNMANLEALLTAKNNQPRTVMGFIGFNENAFRNMEAKWYMPTYMFDKATYPPFAHGPSYILTTDLVPAINRVALTLSYMHLEDIFVAVCISFLNDIKYDTIPNYIAGSCTITQAVACHGCVCS